MSENDNLRRGERRRLLHHRGVPQVRASTPIGVALDLLAEGRETPKLELAE